MDFGLALIAVKNGKMITRRNWYLPGLFVFQQVPASINVKDIVPKMQSLPKNVKDEFIKRLLVAEQPEFMPNIKMALARVNARDLFYIKYHDQLALVDQKNNITGWSPSVEDVLADDWELIENE